VAQTLHVFFTSVDAAAGFVEPDDGDGFGGVAAWAGGELSREVRVEAFGADGDENVD